MVRSDLDRVTRCVAHRSAVECADDLARLSSEDQRAVFDLLDGERALAVFEALEPREQVNLLEALPAERAGALVEAMDPDDRVRLLDTAPEEVRDTLLSRLSPSERRLTAALLSYPPESAGRMMSPEFLALRPEMTVDEAIDELRRRGREAETIYTLPVTDEGGRLIGVVGLRDLVLGEGHRQVGEVMTTDVHTVRADDDQEKVARLVQETDVLAVPVLDGEGALVGLVTADDAMTVLEAESGEDLALTGGSEPIGGPYFSVSLIRLARNRALWLLVLSLAATLTVSVLQTFEDTLAAVVTLALFIPLLMGTGGNAGAQSATTVIRAMALDEVRWGDLGRVVWREVRVGLLLGCMLGAVAYLPVTAFSGRRIAGVVSLTLVVVCTAATFAGSLLPMLARRLGVDPAVMSAPFITTMVDATSLVVYFLVARLLLGL